MEAGRELDALVAEKVMEWTVLTREQAERLDNVSDRVCLLTPAGLMRYYEAPHAMWLLRPWRPSADWAAAGAVMDELHSRGLWVDVGTGQMEGETAHTWGAYVDRRTPGTRASSGPHAICLAALAHYTDGPY